MRLPTLLLLCLLTSATAQAEVVKATPEGFLLRNSYMLKAKPAEVYRQLVAVGSWWNPQHSWSGDAANLSIDAKAGGCFCEKLPDGGSVEHMRVVFAAPGKMLRLAGALGPLQGEAIGGTLTVQLKAKEEGTELTQTFVAGGYSPRGFEAWAPDVDGVMAEQFGRLQKLVDTGKP